MTGARRRALLLAAVAANAVACEAFDESLVATRDSGAPACALHVPPERPAPTPPPDEFERTFVFRDIEFDQREGRWRTLGYDLDGLCSIGDAPEVECRSSAASAPPEEDGEGGIDNSFGHHVVEVFLLFEPGLVEEFRDVERRGVGDPILVVRGWNGQADDDRVDVSFMQGAFGADTAPPFTVERVYIWGEDSVVLNDLDWPLPQWDDDDVFWVRSEGFTTGTLDSPRVRDDNAYVAGRTVVARLPNRFPLLFGSDTRTAVLPLVDAVFTFHITEDGMHAENGVLAGRLSTLDALDVIRFAGVCPGSDEATQVERLLALSADLRATPGSGGPGATCDAVSMVLAWPYANSGSVVGLWEWPMLPDICLYGDGGVPDAGSVLDGGVEAGVADGG